MEIQFYGANCVKISSKKSNIVIDDDIKSLGGSAVAKPSDMQLFTLRPEKEVKSENLVIDAPGEYEASDITVIGVAARAHVDEEDKLSATMYKIVADEIRIAVVGHIYPGLSEKQLEELGVIDVLIVPVGGHGFTLDAEGAAQVIKQIEPKIIIPTQYKDDKLNYPVPAVSLDEVLITLAMEPKEKVARLKLKASDLLNEQPQLIVLERQ